MAKRKTAADKTQKKATDAPGFEEALRRLEDIVEELEDGELDLEEGLARYEEGVAALKRCRDLLASAEERVVQLLEQEGEIREEPFDEDDDE